MTAETPRTRRTGRAFGPGLFVYGTLLDADVRALVLGRPLDAAQLQPAEIKHFRRVYIAGHLYPMILPRRTAVVEGLLLSGLGDDDFSRLDAFEGADYRRERQHIWPVESGVAGEPVLAWLYRSPRAQPSLKEWRLEDWRAREKTIFLRAARAWLAELSLPPTPL